MEPVVTELARRYEGRALVGQVQVETEAALVAEWGVRGWPTFVVVRNGREVDRLLGATTYDRLAAMLDAALAATGP